MSPTPNTSTPRPISGFRSIFVTPSGLRAGWRLLAFICFFVVSQACLQYLLIRYVPPLGELLIATGTQKGEFRPTGLLTLDVTNLIALGMALFAMTTIERSRVRDYGFTSPVKLGALRFGEGVVWGLAMVTALCLALKAEGHFSFGPVVLSAPLAVRYGLLWAAATLAVGLFEETLFRGYGQITLSSGIGFWPSAILLSAAFGLTHLGDVGYTWLGVVTAALFGMIFSLSLRRTGSLWLGIGFHAAFDFAETFLFSPPNGGIANISTHLFASSLSGPSWLTGGGTGVEGGINGLAAFAVVFLLFNWIHPARAKDLGQQAVNAP